jgi:hypothetical protein
MRHTDNTNINAKEAAVSAPNTTADETGIATAVVGPNVLRVGDSFICSGVEQMHIPQGGKHVREAGLRLPVKFDGRPAVTAVVHARTGQPASATVAFAIYSVTVVPLGAGTLIKIQAMDTEGTRKIDDIFDCEYVVIGKAKT